MPINPLSRRSWSRAIWRGRAPRKAGPVDDLGGLLAVVLLVVFVVAVFLLRGY